METLPDSSDTPRRGYLVAALAIVAAHVVLLLTLASRLDWTADERGYILAGHAIVQDFQWDSLQERLQGAAGLIANQTFVSDFDAARIDDFKFAARAGLVPFTVLLLLSVFAWAAEAWGLRGGLLALFLTATSPTLIGYGCLTATDTALAATTVATFWLFWRWLRAPSVLRLCAWGAALGLMMSTKYTSLLIAVALPMLAVATVAQRPERRARALATTIGWLAAGGAVALLVLHATYLFRAGFFDPEVTPLRSPTLQRVDSLPVAGWLLRLLPAPLVIGADYQAAVSVGFSGRFLDYDRAHWAYYLTLLFTKTALPNLILVLAGVIGALRVGVRYVVPCIVAPCALLFVYVTFLSDLHIGVRYILPMFPLLLVLSGAWLRDAVITPGALRVPATVLLCGWMVSIVIVTAPHYLGYFNPIVGGPAGAYRIYTDSNVDWGENNVPGRLALRERHPDITFLKPTDGPRFGKLAILATALGRPDPERTGRTYHWIRRFTPTDNYGAALLVFDIDPGSFENAARDGAERAARDLCLAWIREDDLVKARSALALATSGAGKDRLVSLLDLLEQLREDPAAKATRRLAVTTLYELGRADLAFALIQEAGEAERSELFLALWTAGDPVGAVELLREKADQGLLLPTETLLLAAGLDALGQFAEAMAVLENHPTPSEQDPLYPPFQQFRTELEKKHLAMKRLQELGQGK